MKGKFKIPHLGTVGEKQSKRATNKQRQTESWKTEQPSVKENEKPKW